MSLLSSPTVLRLVDSMAILLNQAYQLARARLASASSLILRLRARYRLEPQIEVRQKHYHGDPRLPVVEISVRLAA